MLEILYRDENFVVINKPHGVFVHRTALSSERVTCLSLLRDQLGVWVYPVHRLDRATSGVLIFALNSDAAGRLGQLYQNKNITKEYLAIVRGYTDDSGVIDHPLARDDTKEPMPAHSSYTTLARVELPYAVSVKHPTARYSLVRVETSTGRLHQVRKHLVHVFHPIIGDTVYGDGRHNKFFRSHFAVNRLCLHASRVRFEHPYTGQKIILEAPLPDDLQGLLKKTGLISDQV